MSWAEVYKINSDLDEPLNFTNYIYDISVFGANSYVMQPMNVKIWNSLSKDSMYLYGHTPIHDIVYNGLSNTNVDNLWNASGKCGRQLNAFYQTQLFSIGNGLAVVKGMTASAFNTLEPKLRDGYSRYIQQFINKSTGVGAWINSTFSLNSSVLSVLNSIDDVIGSTTAITAISTKESAVIAITNCTFSATKLAANSTASSILTSNCLTSLTIYSLINNATFISSAVNDQSTMHIIANSSTAMYDVIRSTIAMTPILNSTVAMTEMAASIIAVNTFIQAETDLSLGSTALANIQTALTAIQSNLPNIIEGSSASDEVTLAKTDINNVTNTINPIISKMSVVQSFVNNFINNTTAMNAIANSVTAMNAMISSTTAMTSILNSTVALTAIVNSLTAMDVIITSTTAMTSFVNSAIALSMCLKTTTSKSSMVNHNTILQSFRTNIYSTVSTNPTYFTLTKPTGVYDSISSGNYIGNNIVVFAIPGSYSTPSSVKVTNMFHGYDGSLVISRYGSYTDTAYRYVGIGGATFTETGDGMVSVTGYTVV